MCYNKINKEREVINMTANAILKNIMNKAMREIEVIKLCQSDSELTQAHLSTLRTNQFIVNFINTPPINIANDPYEILNCLHKTIKFIVKHKEKPLIDRLHFEWWYKYISLNIQD